MHARRYRSKLRFGRDWAASALASGGRDDRRRRTDGLMTRRVLWSVVPAVIGVLALAVPAGAAAAKAPAPAPPKVIATIPLASSCSVAASPVNGDIYATAEGDVTVINPRTDKVITTVNTDGSACDLEVSPVTGNIYVDGGGPAPGGDSVWVISGRTNKVIAAIHPKQAGEDAVAISPRTGDVYVLHGLANSVSEISGKTNKLIATIPLRDGSRSPYTLTVSPVTGEVYVLSDGYTGHPYGTFVSVLSGNTNKIIATATLYSKGALGGIAVNPTTGDVYLANNAASHIWELSGKTNKVIRMLPLPKDVPVAAVAIDRFNGDLYATGNDAVLVFSGKTGKVIGTVGVANLAQQYWGLATSPKTGDAYVTDYWNASLDVISS
jgi:DNA-binding beta-propeller fold protein YncE